MAPAQHRNPDPEAPSRGPSAWGNITRETPPPRPPRLATKFPLPSYEDTAPSSTIVTSSSVSSPSAPDADCAEVDELLEGIERVRVDDLWATPRSHQDNFNRAHKSAPFRAGLFAPPEKRGGIAAIRTATSNAPEVDDLTVPGGAGISAVQSVAPLHCPLSESRSAGNVAVPHGVHPEADFPRLFKVYACPNREACLARGDSAECFGYHAMETDRRRSNVAAYKPHMCRFVEEAGGCRKGDRCPFSHNDFERRYHPDRFGKETCRDFLRGDCPRLYCTFRHEVSGKVEIALTQIDSMNDKEMLQLVLKIGEAKGRGLCEKLLRRFGHGKKHSGWKLEGFNPHGRDDQKVKFVTARVEEVKRQLRASGEKKWASSLKTASLRDMMSGVRKVAEEIRERCRGDENYVESGSDIHRLIRAVFSSTNWSCHSQEGDNPFLVTPENQNDAMTALERLVEVMLTKGSNNSNTIRSLNNKNNGYNTKNSAVQSSATACVETNNRKKGMGGDMSFQQRGYLGMISSGRDFGVIGQKMGLREERDCVDRRTQEVSTLWAFPSSVGQLTA